MSAVSSRPPDEHFNGRREIATAEGRAAADAALEKLKPLLRPDKAEQARLILTRTISKTHSGPIPSAEEMEQMESFHPGATDRCFTMAEKEQDHRHACERDIIAHESGFRNRAQHYALATVFLLLLAVGYIAFVGDTRSAAWLGAATLVGLVTAWTTGKYIEARAEEPVPPPAQQSSPKKK